MSQEVLTPRDEGTDRTTDPTELPAPKDDESLSDELLDQARRGGRLLTSRGALMRVVSIVANLLLISLVAPAELGIFAVVRGVVIIVEQIVRMGFVGALIRLPQDPSRRIYAELTGLTTLIFVSIFVTSVFWPWPFLGFGALDDRWHVWMVVTIASMIFLPAGVGARVRLERQLEYDKLALIDVTYIVLQNAGLVVFALLGKFAVGIFVVHAAMYLFYHGSLVALSRGPRLRLGFKALRGVSGESAGFTAAEWLTVANDYATPILMAKLFGLPVAGVWAFAERLGRVLSVAFSGVRRAATPVAPKLVSEPEMLQRLAGDSVKEAARQTVPAIVLLFVTIPLLDAIWPQWAEGFVIAQVYALSFGLWGIAFATFSPVGIAVKGWRIPVTTETGKMLAGWLLMIGLWVSGSDAIVWLPVAIYIGAALVLMAVTPRWLFPRWNRQLVTLAIALVASLSTYGICLALGLGEPAAAVVSVVLVLPVVPWDMLTPRIPFLRRRR